MKKTVLLKKYVDSLAALNDQLCFFQFNRNELNKKLSDFGEKTGELFTPDVFANNSFAPRINVRIKELPNFQKLNEKFTFGSYLSTSYEVVSYFIKDSLQLLSEINTSTFQVTDDRQLEKKFFLTLGSSGCTQPDIELITTLKYIRLRRNHFTHLAESISDQLKTLVNSLGSQLNSYWSNAISELDFSNQNVLTFSESETIDLLKILRIVTETLDNHLALNLNTIGTIEFLAKREYEPKPQRINEDIVKQRISKIKALGKRDFGASFSDQDIDPIVRIIGKK